MKTKKRISNSMIHLTLLISSFVMLVPFLWMLLTAFKSIAETTSVDPFVIFPSVWRTDAFVSVLHNMNFLRLYWNTILMIAGRILAAVLTATMAGYGFGRLKFKGKNFAFSLILIQMMVPGQIFVIPQYVIISKLGLLNTIFALVFPGLVSAFGTFLLRQAYMGLPIELEEAARLDGCNIGQAFIHVMAPLTKSAMVALGVFTAVFAYRDLMWPMIVNADNNMSTLASALAKMQGQYTSNFPELMSAALIACLPMIVLYLLFQRQFIEGIATSGGKL